GKDEIKDKLMGIQVGADDYLTKPFDTDVLLEQIQEHLRSRQELVETTAIPPLRPERTLLYDSITGHPTVPVVLEKLRTALENGGEVGIFYIELLDQCIGLELVQGWEFIDRVQRTMSQAAHDFCRKNYEKYKPILAASRSGGSGFCVFFITSK